MSALVPDVPQHIPGDTAPADDAVLMLTGERTIPGLDIENYWFRRHEVVYQRLAEHCVDREVLEAGCGEGYGADLIAGVARRVIAVDYDEAAVAHVRSRYPRVDVMQANLAQLPLPESSVDIVVNFQVIEHLSDPVAFLRRCRAQTATDGTVAVVTPNRLRLSNRLRILAGGQPRLGDPQHFKEYVNADLVALGAEAGLACIGSFAYGLTLTIPRLGRSLLPTGASLSLGRLFAPAADCIGVVYRRSR